MKWIKYRGLKFFLLTCSVMVTLTLGVFSCKEKTTKKTADEQAVTPSGSKKYTDTSSSSVTVYDDKGRLCVQQSNTYYELVNYYAGTEKIPMLLKINRIDLCFADSVNRHKVYKISAKSVMDTKDIHWDNQFVATNMEIKDNTILATHEGVGTEEDYLSRFSLLDGKEIFSCSTGDLKVSIPNVKEKRFVGFTSKAAATDPIKQDGTENLLGIIEYSTGTQMVNKLKLLLKRSAVAAKIPTYTPDMVFVPLNSNTTALEDGKTIGLMKADEHYTPADVKDFSLQITFYYGDDNETTKVTIPVVNDQFDLAHANYDKEVFDLSKY